MSGGGLRRVAQYNRVRLVTEAQAFVDSDPTVLAPDEKLPKRPLPLSNEPTDDTDIGSLFEFFLALANPHPSEEDLWVPPHLLLGGESSFADPMSCEMVFHRNIRHFGADFDLLSRIYYDGETAHLYYSDALREKLEAVVSESETLDHPPRRETLRMPTCFRQVSERGYRNFFENLTDEGIDFFTSADEVLLELMVEEAAEDVDIKWVSAKYATGGAIMQDVFEEGRKDRNNLFNFYSRLWEIGAREADAEY